jgi:hypothetical protein
MSIDWNQLSAPFPAEDVEWKPGATTRDKKKGLAMAYITARAIMDRLDEVFTPGGWRNEFRHGPDGGVICRIYFKTGHETGDGSPEWAWREDGAENTDVEAVKGGLSNAMKRAGSALGIGRYLYKLPSQWVPLDDRGRFAQTPRIPREYLPGDARPQGRPVRQEPPATKTRQIAQKAASGEKQARRKPEPAKEPSAPPPNEPPPSDLPTSGEIKDKVPVEIRNAYGMAALNVDLDGLREYKADAPDVKRINACIARAVALAGDGAAEMLKAAAEDAFTPDTPSKIKAFWESWSKVK